MAVILATMLEIWRLVDDCPVAKNNKNITWLVQ
jgi:hypothetical protein